MKIFLKRIFVGVFVFLFVAGWVIAGWQWRGHRISEESLAHSRLELVETRKADLEHEAQAVDWLGSFYISVDMLDVIRGKVTVYIDSGQDGPTAYDLTGLSNMLANVRDTAPEKYKSLALKYYKAASDVRDILSAYSVTSNIPYDQLIKISSKYSALQDCVFQVYKLGIDDNSHGILHYGSIGNATNFLSDRKSSIDYDFRTESELPDDGKKIPMPPIP